MGSVPLSRLSGFDPPPGDLEVPTPLGLEAGGKVLIRPYAPPYYSSMREAVLAFVEHKFAERSGTFRDGGAATAWKDGARVQREIPRYSDRAIEAAIAYAEYIHRRYGRFRASSGPFRTVLAYQAHRLDPDFYQRFYKDDALNRRGAAPAGSGKTSRPRPRGKKKN